VRVDGIALDIHRTEAFNAVLASVPVVDNGCEYVFEGRHHCKPLGGFSDLKAKLDAITGDAVAPYTLHDLRRSGATMMQHLKIRKEVIDACQNHKMQGVSATYLRYGYADEKREAFEKLAAKVLRIVSDVPIVAAPALTNEDAPALTAV
jgi:integrase